MARSLLGAIRRRSASASSRKPGSRDLNKQAAALNAPRRAAARKKAASALVSPAGRFKAVMNPKRKPKAQGPIGTGAGGKANAAARSRRTAAAKKKAAAARKVSQAKLRKRLHGTAKTKKVGTSARTYARRNR